MNTHPLIDLRKLDDAIARIQRRDGELGKELQIQLTQKSRDIALPSDRNAAPASTEFTAKTIVLRTGRPVLAVSNDAAKLTFKDAESEIWRDRLRQSRKILVKAIRAVGRIELKGHPTLDWAGTGWLVAPDIIVTNRHVALEFGRAGVNEYVFRAGVGGNPMQASVDFLEEFNRDEARSFALHKILYIAEDNQPDLAFLQIKGRELVAPIPFSSGAAQTDEQVAIIGYPARDSRIPDQALMAQIFGDVYDKKRLAPGQVDRADAHVVLHDCTTLGGCSGAPLVDLATGSAIGIHFAGRFLEANYAVPAHVVAEQLRKVERGDVRPAISQADHDPIVPSVSSTSDTADEGEVFDTEGKPEDYVDRQGFQPTFLGNGIIVALPAIKRDKNLVLSFEFAGKPNAIELKYEHFSVIMNRERRMCFFSAVNIDGKTSKKSQRAGWLLDPRIPTSAQIKGECYGNTPKFSRGHMTRREDPVWGPDDVAARANTDSMHVTNTVPQMQSFNAPVWLGLEDYALQHARQDGMKICVFTGPVFKSNDPVLFGIKIPVVFWKVIAFVHEGTGKLCATGYSISQEKFLKPDEFVFGAYETYQRSLSWIEQETGLSFGALKRADHFKEREAAGAGVLRDFDEISFY